MKLCILMILLLQTGCMMIKSMTEYNQDAYEYYGGKAIMLRVATCCFEGSIVTIKECKIIGEC